MMAAVYAAQTPQSESQPGVGIQAEGYVPRRIELAGEFHRSAEGGDGRVGHLYAGEHAGRRDAEVQVGEHLRGGRSVQNWKLLLWHVVHVEDRWPALDFDDIVGLLKYRSI